MTAPEAAPAAVRRPALSRGFSAALAGIGMTLLAWYGPWVWPAAPAFAVLEAGFGNRSAWMELEYGVRAAVLVVLIVVNVGVWALLFVGVAALVRRLMRAA